MIGGRLWYWYPFFSVAMNDAMAYFAGRAFGEHQLIGLSPNKTIEGFIGGLVFNILWTIFLAKKILTESQIWMCGAQRFTLPFENYQCESLPKVYNLELYSLPFPIFGHSSIELSPAMLYCCIYCLFIGLFARFFI